MAAQDDDLSRLLAASGLERSELVAEKEEQLRAAVEERRAWLDATLVLGDEERRQLAAGAVAWRATIGTALELLAKKARTIADIAAIVDPVERPDVWAALAADLEAVAAGARAQAAIVSITTAIDRRLGEEA